jgi:hypothetical protein
MGPGEDNLAFVAIVVPPDLVPIRQIMTTYFVSPSFPFNQPMFSLLLQCVDKAKPLAYNPSQFWSRSYLIDASTGFRGGIRPSLAQMDDFYCAQ